MAGKKTLVGEGCDDRDDRDAEERADAVERLEAREVVEEELEQRHAEERERGIAAEAEVFPEAREQQREREDRPRDGVGHVAREVPGELEHQRPRARRREEVRDLDVEEQEGEHGAERGEQRGGVHAEGAIARRREQAGAQEEARDRGAERIEIPVENRAGARVVGEDGGIEREARESRDEQHDTSRAQPVVRHTVEQPQQRRTLERPGDRDPLAVELDGEDERDEEQRRTAEPRELVEPRALLGHRRAQDGDEAGERQ